MGNCKNSECDNEITNNKVYCSLKCRNYYVNKYLRDYSKLRKTNSIKREVEKNKYDKSKKSCLFCGSRFEFNEKHKKFCNNSCSAKYNNSNRNIKNRNFTDSGMMNIRFANKQRSIYDFDNPPICVICKNVIDYEKRKRKTCSDGCYRKLLSMCAKKNKLGGETNYKKFKYKGVCMDSSWEVEIAKWFDVNGIFWIRSKHINFKWKDGDDERIYYPDFYLPKLDVYIDTKNSYLIEQDEIKIEYVRKHHKINLLVGDVEYIKNKIM